MANLTIRNLDDKLKSLLRQQAARHGCSMEQEARDILRRAVQAQPAGAGFAQRIHQRFAGLKAESRPLERHDDSNTSAGERRGVGQTETCVENLNACVRVKLPYFARYPRRLGESQR